MAKLSGFVSTSEMLVLRKYTLINGPRYNNPAYADVVMIDAYTNKKGILEAYLSSFVTVRD